MEGGEQWRMKKEAGLGAEEAAVPTGGYGTAMCSHGSLLEGSPCAAPLCVGWEVCCRSPLVCITDFLLQLEAANCCQGQDLLLLWNGGWDFVKRPFRRESQITPAIFHSSDLFVLVTDISVMNGCLIDWEFCDFSKWLHGCISALGIYVCVHPC